jgi:serine/threonine protein kinase/Flp pilus assembly protein TadD
MTDASALEDGALDSLVAQIADEFAARQKQGEQPDVEEYAARHPEIAPVLRRVLASLQLLGLTPPAGATATEEPASGVLGDFRILRELGRGGMGVVYEAEQISLGRRVALKVLPLAATMDPRQLQRFHNEARAAACLHHANIVPVFAVGQDRGVHYYAMQLIEGRTLAAVIRELQQSGRKGSPAAKPVAQAQAGPADADATPPHTPAPLPPAVAPSTAPQGALSTLGSVRGAAFFQTVAQLGVQAAEALEHAHQVGVVHRDVKPANLLLDGRGMVWVADFGLAQLQSQAGPTMTGDLVGTLRYMSPEQALAQRVAIDQRTDVYSLGATLYELLTLRPVFEGGDRQELLRQIAFEEPTRPRRLNAAIPAELETVVLKALEKSPQDRYGTAQEAADDLRRFLEDRPVKARRPSWGRAAAKWARRHQTVVWSTAAALALVLAVLGGSVGWVMRDREARRAETERVVDRALAEVESLRQGRKYPEALAAARRAERLLGEEEGHEELRRRVWQVAADLTMVARLEDIRLRTFSLWKDYSFDYAWSDQEYARAFRDYGIDVGAIPPAEAARQLQARAVRVELAAGLDDWAEVLRRASPSEDGRWKDLLEVARGADGDELRGELRQAVQRGDRNALEKLASSASRKDLPVPTASLLGATLFRIGAIPQAVAVLREAQRLHPEDFCINCSLAFACGEMQPPLRDDSIRFYTAARSIRPDSTVTLNNLGNALVKKGLFEEASREYQRAIEIEPKYAFAHIGLGNALRDKGKLDEAIGEYRQAIELDPRRAYFHCNLGIALSIKGPPEEAIGAYLNAIALDPEDALSHTGLGDALRDKGQPDEAICEYHRALVLQPNDANAHNRLGAVLYLKGQREGAICEFRRAIELDRKDARTHTNLGVSLKETGQLDEAVRECRSAIDLDPKFPQAHAALGEALLAQGRFAQAWEATRRSLELLAPKNPLRRRLTNQLQQCEQALQDRLSAILEGKAKPADDAERLILAEMCQRPIKKLYAASVRLYVEAFDDDAKLADDLNAPHRYNAACAAALAGCGQGVGPTRPDKEQGGLRRQALEWLRAELDAYHRLLEKEPDRAGGGIAQQMQHWLQDNDFAGLRGPEALAKLPKAEGQAWSKLWVEVAEMLARAEKAAAPEPKSGAK